MAAMPSVNAKEVLGAGETPIIDGQRLAQHIIEQRLALPDLSIDLTGIAPEDLAGESFINAMLHALEEAGYSIRGATQIQWVTDDEAEAKRLVEAVDSYVDDMTRVQ
jgi:hypothetical protein